MDKLDIKVDDYVVVHVYGHFYEGEVLSISGDGEWVEIVDVYGVKTLFNISHIFEGEDEEDGILVYTPIKNKASEWRHGLSVCKYVVAFVNNHFYRGQVIRFSQGGDCVDLEDVNTATSHFYISDVCKDPNSVISVYTLKHL